MIKKNTHIVLKKDDIDNYLNQEEICWLDKIMTSIQMTRKEEGKPLNNQYYICNKDEPYADTVLQVILDGEDKKIKRVKTVHELKGGGMDIIEKQILMDPYGRNAKQILMDPERKHIKFDRSYTPPYINAKNCIRVFDGSVGCGKSYRAKELVKEYLQAGARVSVIDRFQEYKELRKCMRFEAILSTFTQTYDGVEKIIKFLSSEIEHLIIDDFAGILRTLKEEEKEPLLRVIYDKFKTGVNVILVLQSAGDVFDFKKDAWFIDSCMPWTGEWL